MSKRPSSNSDGHDGSEFTHALSVRLTGSCDSPARPADTAIRSTRQIWACYVRYGSAGPAGRLAGRAGENGNDGRLDAGTVPPTGERWEFSVYVEEHAGRVNAALDGASTIARRLKDPAFHARSPFQPERLLPAVTGVRTTDGQTKR